VAKESKVSWQRGLLLKFGLVLLASVGGLIMCPAPIFKCPACNGSGIGAWSWTLSDDRVRGPSTVPCVRCGETGRITFNNRCSWIPDRNHELDEVTMKSW
jgi:hypothetical protein